MNLYRLECYLYKRAMFYDGERMLILYDQELIAWYTSKTMEFLETPSDSYLRKSSDFFLWREMEILMFGFFKIILTHKVKLKKYFIKIQSVTYMKNPHVFLPLCETTRSYLDFLKQGLYVQWPKLDFWVLILWKIQMFFVFCFVLNAKDKYPCPFFLGTRLMNSKTNILFLETS